MTGDTTLVVLKGRAIRLSNTSKERVDGIESIDGDCTTTEFPQGYRFCVHYVT